MVLKCCVPLCKGNYDSSSERVPLYKLPKDEEEKRKWISVIPRANLVVSKYTAVCGKHWPNDAEMIKVHGKLRPKIHLLSFPEFRLVVCPRNLVLPAKQTELFRKFEINTLTRWRDSLKLIHWCMTKLQTKLKQIFLL